MFQGTFEEEIEVDRFYPAEKFLQGSELRDFQKTDFPSDPAHFFELTDDVTIIFFSVFFEENNGQKLVPGIISPRIVTGIQGEV